MLAGLQGLSVAQTYPDRPISLVVGFPPGGGAEGVARLISEALGRELQQPVIHDYKPGAGTSIAAAFAARAAPDGYTLYLSTGGHYGADKVLYKGVTYSGASFTPIAGLVRSPLIVAVNTASGIESTEELLARARADPRQIFYASSGAGVPTHLAGLLLVNASGVRMTHVPYKGGALAVQAVAAGDAQVTFATPPSVLPLAKTGKVRMIAVTSRERSPLFPDLPAVAEAGVPDYDYTYGLGLYGPANLPRAIVDRIAAATLKILSDPELRAKLAAGGNEPAPSANASEFARWAEADGKRQKELTQQAGAAIQ
ncbi:tripartite tricarboxylate transporter substrate binding protein [Variovorax sp. WS11]|uniref:Bug family tripartite tricarboxylate transporter substrate binding protein n=1 Tax=Variovorax sp. WS11 TaxID=1105204 RepID=UPI0031BB9462